MPCRKFDNKTVNEIRNLGLHGVYFSIIADKYKSALSAIANIIRNKTYKDIPFEKMDLDFENLRKIRQAKVLDCYPKNLIIKNVDDLKSGVYIIKNIINDKCYVGSSIKIRERLGWHYNMLLNKKHPNVRLQSAFDLYGKDNFEFIPLLNTKSIYNTKLEQWVLDKSNFKCDYNIATNCESSMLNVKMSEEAKENLRIKATNRKHTIETKKLMSDLKIERIKNDVIYKNKLLSNIISSPIGEKNPNSKLCEKDVIEIKTHFKKGKKVKDLLGKYNCSENMLYEIKNGRNWKHITV
jgi:group I intron endonuclease